MDRYQNWNIKEMLSTSLDPLQGMAFLCKKQLPYILVERFLAKEFGLAGKTNVEVAKADEVVDAITDLQNSAVRK